MSEDMMRADKAYRKKIFLVYALLVSLGALISKWGLPWMQDYLRSRSPEEALQYMKVALSVMFLAVLPIAFYLWSFGRKVISSRRLPPPGVRVIKDTPILEGEAARKRGQLMVVLSLFLALAGLLGAFYTPYLISKAFGTNAGAAQDGGSQ